MSDNLLIQSEKESADVLLLTNNLSTQVAKESADVLLLTNNLASQVVKESTDFLSLSQNITDLPLHVFSELNALSVKKGEDYSSLLSALSSESVTAGPKSGGGKQGKVDLRKHREIETYH